MAQKRLKAAAAALKAGNKDAFYAAIEQAAWTYLSDRLSIPTAELNKDNIAALLQQKGVSEALIADVKNVLSTAEFARYAPSTDHAMDDLYRDTLWLLLTIPVFVAAYIWYTFRKRRQLEQFGDPELMEQLMPNASRQRPAIKFSILMVALALLIIAAARPQFGQSERTEKRQGIEAIVALDISNSMLAEDVAPNRLDRAKQMLSKLMDNMVDDKVGLVVFAGDAFVQHIITEVLNAVQVP